MEETREWTFCMSVRSQGRNVYRSGSIHPSFFVEEEDFEEEDDVEEEPEWRASALRRSEIVLNPLSTSLPTKKNLARLPRSISLRRRTMTFPKPDAAPVMTITGAKLGLEEERERLRDQASLKVLLRSFGEGEGEVMVMLKVLL